MSSSRICVLAAVIVHQCFSAAVPDEAVIPEWERLFKEVLAGRKFGFRNLIALPPSVRVPDRRVSDDDLLHGKPTAPRPLPSPPGSHPTTLKLAGADSCYVDDGPPKRFMCEFWQDGQDADKRATDYVRAVRLLEKSTGCTPNSRGKTGPYARVTSTEERRSVSLFCSDPSGTIRVEQTWRANTDARQDLRPKIAIGVIEYLDLNASLPSFGAPTTPSGLNIYSVLPKAERLGSSGTGPVSVRITNETPYTLSITYDGVSGAIGATASVRSGGTQTLQLSAGSFRVSGRVDTGNVAPFVGSEHVEPGDRLAVTFSVR